MDTRRKPGTGKLIPALSVRPLSPETANDLLNKRVASHQWWILLGVRPSMRVALERIESGYYEGDAKPDLQLLTGLSGPTGPWGLVIMAKKKRLPAEGLANLLARIGSAVSFEVLEEKDLLFLTTPEDGEWIAGTGGMRWSMMPALIGAKMIPEGKATGEDTTRAYTRLIEFQHGLFGVSGQP